MKIIIIILLWYITDRITCIILSNYFRQKCKSQCYQCGMWSCTFPTKYRGKYKIPPYEDYSNVCGKFKRQIK